MANELVDEPHAARLTGADHLAGEHQLHGIDRACLPDRPARAAEAGKEAEVDLGEPEPGLVVVDRNPVMAC